MINKDMLQNKVLKEEYLPVYPMTENIFDGFASST